MSNVAMLALLVSIAANVLFLIIKLPGGSPPPILGLVAGVSGLVFLIEHFRTRKQDK